MESLGLFGDSSALISGHGLYRYKLWRKWDIGPTLGFIMLNPSTADGSKDDPTTRRCMMRASKMGFGSLLITNLYAYRTVSPQVLSREGYLIGEDNDAAIEDMARSCQMIIVGWGIRAQSRRVTEVMKIIMPFNDEIYHLGLATNGMPKHPLYIGYDVKPEKFIWGKKRTRRKL